MAKIKRPDRSREALQPTELDENLEVVFDEPESPPPRGVPTAVKSSAATRRAAIELPPPEPGFDLESVLDEIDALELEPDDAFLTGDRERDNKLASETTRLNPAVPTAPAKTASRTAQKPTAGTKSANHGKPRQPVSDSDVDLLFDRQDSPTAGSGPFQEHGGTAVAEPPKKASRTASSISAPAKKSGIISAKPAYQRTAQASLADGRGSAMPLVAVAVLAVAVLSAGGVWLFSGSSGPPQSRYLPRDCDLVVSLKWSDLPTIAADPKRAKPPEQPPEKLPGLALVERSRLFIRNAGLHDGDVERVHAGRAADGSGLVLVYQLSRAVRAQVVADLHPFRSRRKSAGPTETIGGVPVYSLGPTVIAFPEPQVILNGETDLVREILQRWSHGIAAPIREYLQAADFSATSVVISARGSEPLLDEDLQVPSRLADAVRGATARFQYGDQLCLTRTLHLSDPRIADELCNALQNALSTLAKDPKTPPTVRQSLTEAQVSASQGQVQIELTLPATQVQGRLLEALNRLF